MFKKNIDIVQHVSTPISTIHSLSLSLIHTVHELLRAHVITSLLIDRAGRGACVLEQDT